MRQFFRVNSYNEEYGYHLCSDNCGNQFKIDLFSDGSIAGSPTALIGKKISVEALMLMYVGIDSKEETRLR